LYGNPWHIDLGVIKRKTERRHGKAHHGEKDQKLGGGVGILEEPEGQQGHEQKGQGQYPEIRLDRLSDYCFKVLKAVHDTPTPCIQEITKTIALMQALRVSRIGPAILMPAISCLISS
jgi:hypothetical protein